jgi:hypothetical protein
MALVDTPVGDVSFSNIRHAPESIQGTPDLKGAGATTVTVDSEVTTSPEEKNSTFQLEEHPVDEVRPIKVGIIGAGLAGITAGVMLPAKLPGLDLRIYDKNADVVCQLIACCIHKLMIFLGRNMVNLLSFQWRSKLLTC